MKVNYMISTAAVLAALLTVSCTKDLQENAPVSGKDSDKVTLLIAADEVTKTTFGDDYEVKWEDASDKIGLFIASSSTNVPASLTRNEAGKAYFEATVSEYASGDKLCAYYPYADKAGTDASKVTLKIPYIQTQAEANKFNGANNPMIAVPVALPSAENVTDGTVVISEQLKFRHIGAVLEFDITGVPSGEKLKSVQFVADGGFPATDNSVYDLTSVTENGDVNTVAGTYYKSVTVSLQGDGFTPGQSAKVYMTIVPGTYNGNIYISTDKNLYRYAGKTIKADRAAVKTIKADLSSTNVDKSKEIKSALDYEVFAMAANAGDYSAWVDNGEVKLGADISTSTYFTRIQEVWTGKFNGQDHTIKQDASVVPLFTVIDEKASVSRLVLEGSKKSMANAGGYGSAAVAQINKGTIENVTNKMVTDLNVTGGSAIAGMVKCNGGTMRNCVQEGNITINAVIKATTTLYVGGIAAFASDADEVSTSKAVGRFENCTNAAKINVSRTSTKAASLAKFAVGGICAIVHKGSKDGYSVFSVCHNTGDISVADKDKTSSNGAVAMGGIIGRISNYFSKGDNAIAVNITEGYYAKIENCTNTAVLENASYSTAPLISGQSGARVGATGGIVGYANGLKAKSIDIIGCTNTGRLLGGYAKNCLLGGICGQTNYANIENAIVEVEFGDSSLSSSDSQFSAVGGIVGSSLNTLTVKDSFVDISGSLTPSPVGIGVLQGFVKSGTPKYTGIQIRANLAYNNGAGKLEVTQETVENAALYCPKTLNASDITYWNK